MKNSAFTKDSSSYFKDLPVLLRNISCGISQLPGLAEEEWVPLFNNTQLSKENCKVFLSTDQLFKTQDYQPEILFTLGSHTSAAVKEIRKKFPIVPLIVIDKNPTHTEKEQCLRLGVSSFLNFKNLKPARLQECIFAALQKPVLQAANQKFVLPKQMDKRFEALFENALAVIFFTKPDGSILDCNEAAVDLLGYSKEEILTYGRRLFIDHTDPNLHALLAERTKQKCCCGELKITTKEGKNLTCLFSSSLFTAEDGEEYSSTLMIDITERKKAVLRLQHNEKLFQALVQDGGDMFGILKEDGEYTYVSRNSANILGSNAQDMEGKNAFDYIHPEDVERVSNQFQLLKTNKRITIPAFRFIDGNGNWQWIETTATNRLDEEGIEGIVVNSRVVTGFVEMEQQLHKTLREMQNIMDSSLDIISTIDAVGRFTTVSKASEAIVGYSPEELIGRKVVDFVHETDIKRTIKTARNIMEGQNLTNFENRFRRKNGKLVPLIWSGHWNEEQQLMYAIARDGTERKLADEKINSINEELRQSNEKFLYSLKATNETIWAYDVASEEILWGDGLERHFGHKLEQNSEPFTQWLKKIHEEDRERVKKSFMAALATEDENFWFEKYRFRKKCGEYSYVLDRGYIVRNKEQKPLKIVGAVLDITENHKKTLEIEEKNKKLMEITWLQSHVVRAPVARIMGLIDVLENSKQEEEKTEALNYLKQSAKELDQITREIVEKSEYIREEGQ